MEQQGLGSELKELRDLLMETLSNATTQLQLQDRMAAVERENAGGAHEMDNTSSVKQLSRFIKYCT